MKPALSLVVLAACLLAASVSAAEAFVTDAPQIPIWPATAPGTAANPPPERWVEGGKPDAFHLVTDVHVPTLTLYLPSAEKAVGTAVIIAPGGGHRYLVVDLEGEFVAKKLNELGIAAFVLRYRLAHADGSTYQVEKEALADMQQAIRVVHSRASEWHINPERIGVMGFSAGGQLAALAETHFDATTRPAFAVLGYPAYLSENDPVPADAPPTVIYANEDDSYVTSATGFYLALRKAGISTELHIFRRGGHGVGATGREPGFDQLPTSHWFELLNLWLRDLGMLQ